ncbi:TIGR04219 family outer membrane beta-barrel protein [Pseudidiomarina terrestris]|uniref:TIGR04219 family outer membrane beta-barrel protein n=1 Tax=Pseudidiomarina terrestris TaxID=2820060 RepID=UPI002653953A|nr:MULTISPECIES: TIGR04219 family outer membrane beta-barrel protein [unclassified Pseudidiomarina]MDN7127317.1 TIGR04219 family outer membrane beta-barrel protein [Pseudidiomarina sp. 1APR75-33.1]MDN7136193.1 TIGR04219 family outer membrane beta-barrel protein [Pseudidiomarina sp. 1ASP75-5]MEA3588868.1 TIGR04219 family outer membrane beta-barrel protein [Pseudidiomarina sp. 1APP75-27a]
MADLKLTRVSTLLACCLLSAPVAADTVFGVYAGGQYWQTDTSGSFGSNSNAQEFDFEDEQQKSYYIAFEHPIPMFPNLKVRHNELVSSGQQTLSQDFNFFGTNFSAGTSAAYQTDLTHTDYTFYYELFDNDLLTFDLGLTAKRVEGELAVQSQQLVERSATDGWVPTLYSQLRVGIPATPLTFYGTANAVSIDDSKIEDYDLGIEYRVIENLAIDVNLQLGYRAFAIELDDLDGVYSNLDYKGPYLGLELHF